MFSCVQWGPLHPYNSYVNNTEQTGRWHLNTGDVLQAGEFPSDGDADAAPVRIAIAADWAAGTRESDYVQQVMMVGNGTAFNPHWTLHVGDVSSRVATTQRVSCCSVRCRSQLAASLRSLHVRSTTSATPML